MNKKFLPKLLTVGCWNIQGLHVKVNGVKLCKLDNESFTNTIKKFDLLCLQETHTSQLENFKIQNYVTIAHCCIMSKNNRYFGGMLLFIKKSLRKGILIKQDFDVDALKITLRNDFFGLKNDINIMFTYASPVNSCYTKSRGENILEKIETQIVDA